MPNTEYLKQLYEQLREATALLKEQQNEVNIAIKELTDKQDVCLLTMDLVKNIERRIKEKEEK
ncbi:hypothetical protein AM7_032 [Lactococcus phage AM7]|uniref:Uncharacterized protein n=2 Tax=Teubervirus AM6 TaxID=2845190 RepID=A0A1W6JID3_9CAUD|nr:hypothetical protein H1N71_gp32 [Lactococcus phage AM6]ARM65979.1 hypothetical protein AM6_032 [Lactococcus phage AM6]ARM66069.1 hypothetical protein AM7_032 [Lactococcus phage AM7]